MAKARQIVNAERCVERMRFRVEMAEQDVRDAEKRLREARQNLRCAHVELEDAKGHGDRA